MGAFAGGGKRVFYDDMDIIKDAINSNDLTLKEYVVN